MKLKVLIQPVDITNLSASVMDINFHIPAFLMKGALRFKPQLESAAAGIARTSLQKKGIDLQLDNFELLIDPKNNMVEGCIVSFGDIDYPQLASTLLPEAKIMLADRPDMQPVLEIIELLGQDTDTITRDTLDIIGPERTEQLLQILMTAYNDRVCKAINQQLNKKQDKIKITEIIIL